MAIAARNCVARGRWERFRTTRPLALRTAITTLYLWIGTAGAGPTVIAA
jgi:hypothetical protein